MTQVFDFIEGKSPLLVSVPHDGRLVPDDIAALMSDAGRSLPDTDWHVSWLFDFARDLDASMIIARYSRYVVDLNRPADDAVLYEGQVSTGLCPVKTFAGESIYEKDPDIDRAGRIENFWRPYHDRIESTLAKLRERHGHALLFDAHSIESRVPRLFDGELPELNIGTWDGCTCSSARRDAVAAVAASSGYSHALDGRFKGGYTTRNYGRPAENFESMQLEIAQRTYMNESTRELDENRASQLRDTLRAVLAAFTMPA